MKGRLLLIALAGVLNFVTSCNEKKDAELNSGKFKTGQVWKYNNRPGEDSSTLTILKIEKYDHDDTIIHIRVDGVKLYSPNAASGYLTYIGHMPFSEKIISKSVTQLVGQINDLPDFSQGYDQWKFARDRGQGGYWKVDLKEAIAATDSSMRQKR